jgi:hypothetical protein
VPEPDSVFSELAELRRELQEKLQWLVEKRPGLERELQALDEQVDYTRRQLELLEATERQLEGQGRGQPGMEGGASGPSTQVRRGEQVAEDIVEPVWLTGACGRAMTGQRHVSGGCPPQGAPITFAPCRAAASAPPHEGPPHSGRTTCYRC